MSNITVTLRGEPDEFVQFPELTIKKDQNAYSSMKITSPSQLRAAALAVGRAYELFERGRGRTKKKQKLIEV